MSNIVDERVNDIGYDRTRRLEMTDLAVASASCT